MNKKIFLLLFIILILPLIILNEKFEIINNVKGNEDLSVLCPLRSIYEGNKTIFAATDLSLDIAEKVDGEIKVIQGFDIVKFLTSSSFSIDYKGPQLPSPIAVLEINFKPKVIKGATLRSVNITYELKYKNAKINFIYPDRILSLEGSNEKFIKVGREIRRIAPTGEIKVKINIFALGEIGAISTTKVEFKNIIQYGEKGFEIADSHFMFFDKEFKNVTHEVILPISYETYNWDKVYLRIFYPKFFTLSKALLNKELYSFDDWEKEIQGNATVLIKESPFGIGEVRKELHLYFTSYQSIYDALTISPFNKTLKVWAEGETFGIVGINLDIEGYRITPEKFQFLYYIFDPNMEIFRVSIFEKEIINKSKEAPLGEILIGFSNITLDFINNNSGVWSFVITSLSPYNLGCKAIRIVVYSVEFIEGRIFKATNLEFEGSFSFKINNVENVNVSLIENVTKEKWRFSYLILTDPASRTRSSFSKLFNYYNDIGVTSLSIRNKIIRLGEINVASFLIYNNSSDTKTVSKIILRFHIFNQTSTAEVNLFEIGESKTFYPRESRLYFFFFTLSLNTPLGLIKSTKTGKELNITFPENFVLNYPLRYKVWKLEITIGNNSAISDWLLFEPKKASESLFKGDIIEIKEVKISEEGVSNFSIKVKNITDLKKLEIFALASTNNYITAISYFFKDNIRIVASIDESFTKIVAKEGEEITIPVKFVSLTNYTEIKFDVYILIGNEILVKEELTIKPQEEKIINLNFKMPKENEVKLLKLKSDTLKLFIAYIELEWPKEFGENIVQNIPVFSEITEYVPPNFALITLILGVIFIFLIVLTIKKVIERVKKQ